jgi:hypothetical protein
MNVLALRAQDVGADPSAQRVGHGNRAVGLVWWCRPSFSTSICARPTSSFSASSAWSGAVNWNISTLLNW